MKAFVLTSNSPRHAHFAYEISKHYELVGCIREDKGQYYSNQRSRSEFVENHFNNLKLLKIIFWFFIMA